MNGIKFSIVTMLIALTVAILMSGCCPFNCSTKKSSTPSSTENSSK